MRQNSEDDIDAFRELISELPSMDDALKYVAEETRASVTMSHSIV